MKSHGFAGWFEYVCALSQNRSSKIYLFSFEKNQKCLPNPAISLFDNEIQITMPLHTTTATLIQCLTDIIYAHAASL